MSHSYSLRIPLQMQLSEAEKAGRGKMTLSFDLLGILPPEKMKEILGKILSEKGWASQDGVWEKILPDHSRLTIDPEKLHLGIDISPTLTDQINITINRETLSKDPKNLELTKMEKEWARDIVANQLIQDQELVLKVAIRARQELNSALKDVYRKAIMEKAQTIGTIASVSESSQNGTLRIRVEIQ